MLQVGSMTDLPESAWEAVPNPTRRSSEFGRHATRVGVVVVTTTEENSGRGTNFRTVVRLHDDQSLILCDDSQHLDERLAAALERHRAVCRFWAKAERQAIARAWIKEELG